MTPDKPNLEFEFTMESDRSGVVEDPQFRLLVLGDWSADAAKREVADRKPAEIDRDNFDDVMRSLGVRLLLEMEGGNVDLEFASLDDFHPDELYKRVPVFSELRELRKRLRNADTFNSAAREVREKLGASDESDTRVEAAEPRAEAGNLLDSILSDPSGGGTPPKAALSSDISRLVGEIVRPHLVSVDENEQSAMVAAVDEATSSLMRSILHDRRFQQLEASWRGLFFLIRNSDTASDLKIFVLDLSASELAADLKNASSQDGSAFHRRLAAGVSGERWTAVLGNYAFHVGVDDVAALARIGRSCSALGVPFISHVRPDLLGVDSLFGHANAEDWDISGSTDASKLWNVLREVPESAYVGVVMPRFLSRLPYGSSTEPTEVFSFEEFTGKEGHDGYLWANPCFLVGNLMAATFRDSEFEWGRGIRQDIDGLPLHMYREEGTTAFQSPAEVQLSEKAAQILDEQGVMPLVSFRNSDRVRLVSFRSINRAEPVLRGIWSRGQIDR